MKSLLRASKVVTRKVLNIATLTVMAVPAFADVSARKPVDPKGSFAKLTGQISQLGQSNSAYGNAFVVGSEGCHVLTNFHVAFGKSVDPKTSEVEMVDDVAVGHTVDFSFGLDTKSGKFQETIKAKVIEFGNYESGTARGFLGDIALLKLDRCLGKDFGSLEIDRPATDKLVPTGKLMTVSSSRAAGGKNEVLVEEGCRAVPGTSVTGMMLSNCVNVPGMSGSMILEEGLDKKWRLVGMSTTLNSFNDGTKISKALYARAINKFLDGATVANPLRDESATFSASPKK